MPADNRLYRLSFKIFSVLCVIAAAVCLICDLAINRALIWSPIVVITVALAWLPSVPLLLFRRGRVPLALLIFSAALPLYLFFLAALLRMGWFTPLALPIALVSLIALWLVYLLARFLKINGWYKSAAYVLIASIVSIIVNVLVRRYEGTSYFVFTDLFTIVPCLAVSVLLWVIGFGKKNPPG